MSGPPYPPGPAPGSNAIGSFVIGESPIGTIKSFDQIRTVISQYANSDRLMALINNFDGYVDQTANLDLFFDMIFNVDTAQGVGLDIWGRIVGVPRVLRMVALAEYFGFDEGDGQPFGQQSFYPGAPLTQNFRLGDDAYRQLILCKAMANICDGSIPAINQILMRMFPARGNAYVSEGTRGEFFGFLESTTGAGFNQQPLYIDAGLRSGTFFGFDESGDAVGFNQAPFFIFAPSPGMKFSYVFEFKLSPVELAIVQESGALPKPVGVTATVIQVY